MARASLKPSGMVTRQTLYMVADITTEVMFCVPLSQLVQERNATEGHAMAREPLRP